MLNPADGFLALPVVEWTELNETTDWTVSAMPLWLKISIALFSAGTALSAVAAVAKLVLVLK